MDKLKIGAILDVDDKPKEGVQFRVGRLGRLSMLHIGLPMAFVYSDGHGTLVTSSVIDITEDDYGLWVKTENGTQYRLDHEYFEEENNGQPKEIQS